MQNIICPTPDGGYFVGIRGNVIKIDPDAVSYAERMAHTEVVAGEVPGLNHFLPFSMRVQDRMEQFLMYAAENKVSDDEIKEVRVVDPEVWRLFCKAIPRQSPFASPTC